MKNFAQIKGNLGSDSITTKLPSGKKVTRFSVAINKTWNKNGERHTVTDWVRVSAWGKLTEFTSKLKKGHPVLVQGELRTSLYKGVQTFEVVASECHKLDYLNDVEETPVDAEEGELEDDYEGDPR
jgi:single-strand DNA-binding protein